MCSLTLASPHDQGKIDPQQMKTYEMTLHRTYWELLELGVTKKARPVTQPSPSGISNTLKVRGLKIAGAGFEPATFGL